MEVCWISDVKMLSKSLCWRHTRIKSSKSNDIGLFTDSSGNMLPGTILDQPKMLDSTVLQFFLLARLQVQCRNSNAKSLSSLSICFFHGAKLSKNKHAVSLRHETKKHKETIATTWRTGQQAVMPATSVATAPTAESKALQNGAWAVIASTTSPKFAGGGIKKILMLDGSRWCSFQTGNFHKSSEHHLKTFGPT